MDFHEYGVRADTIYENNRCDNCLCHYIKKYTYLIANLIVITLLILIIFCDEIITNNCFVWKVILGIAIFFINIIGFILHVYLNRTTPD